MAEQQIQAPLPGVFYRRPSPNEDPFFEPGDTVSADDTIGLIEVMKQFSEVKAGADGVLKEFLVENEVVVGPGDAVAVLEVS